MHFKNPEILYALFALAIPVLIHLFNLQRYEKTPFSNVKLLQNIVQQTRKSAQLKKWLILSSRILLLGFLILAFAQPYLSNDKDKLPVKTYIYLDNSWSMNAEGAKGKLLQEAINGLVNHLKSSKMPILLLTNDQPVKKIENEQEVIRIGNAPIQKKLSTVLIEIDGLKAENNQRDRVILISDFQRNFADTEVIKNDSLTDLYLVQLQPLQAENISIDSVSAVQTDPETQQYTAVIKNYAPEPKTVAVSFHRNAQLEGKTSLRLEPGQRAEVYFKTTPKTGSYGDIRIDDPRLIFDNTLYYSDLLKQKKKILCIGKDDAFLRKLYTDNDFTYTQSELKTADLSALSSFRLLILNRVEKFGEAFIFQIDEYLKKGGNVALIPAEHPDTPSYNSLFSALQLGKFPGAEEGPKLITTINYNHPFFNNVFSKQIKNFKYPFVNRFYPAAGKNMDKLLKFEDGRIFIGKKSVQKGSLFWVAAPLTKANSNFTESALIVPVFYNFTLENAPVRSLYGIIGMENRIEIPVKLKKDEVIRLVKDEERIIPRQEIMPGKVIITTRNEISKAGIYAVMLNGKPVGNIAFNYSRTESNPDYISAQSLIDKQPNAKVSNNINAVFQEIEAQQSERNLWQLFLIFALLFLIVEIILQKMR